MPREFTEAPWDVHNFPGNYNGVDGWEITFHNSADIAMLYAAPEMYALLKSLEWSITFFITSGSCPICSYGKNDGHDDSCNLAAVLKAVEGEA